MPQIKHLDTASAGAVTLAFCPERTSGPSLLAAGTVAGAVDMNFSSNSVLEIVGLDWASPVETPGVLGSVQAPERFNRLAWGQRVAADNTFPSMGLLAGGLADGSVCLWDPTVIVARGEGRPALLAKMQKHTGAVKGLEFNSFSPNLLASGAADSDLCIWDLAKPATPSLYPALKGPTGSAGNEITHISWNRKVQHILASCASNGTTVVWDLKKQKPVISFRDPNSQRRASCLQWNPEVATQLVVASDADSSPTLQMWDLRNSAAPLKEFVGHSKGVLGMSWCPHDSSFLLSAGKDCRNICWDVNTTDIVCELPATNYNFDIQWSPHSRGVFATSCKDDGKVGLYNLDSCTGGKMIETVNTDFTVTKSPAGDSIPLKRVPAWMKRPCCATFGFGGKLVSIVNHKTSSTDASGQVVQRESGTISIKQVVTENELVQRSEQFEHAIAGGEKPTLQAYCATKAEATASMDPDEAETWSFLALLFESNGRRELLKKLGFEDVMARDQSQAQVQVPDANGHHTDASAAQDDGRANGIPATPSADNFFGGQEDDPDFFDKLPDEGLLPGTPVKSPTVGAAAGGDGDLLAPRLSHMGMDGTPETSHELEDDIQRAMIAGNYESAVETCFKAHRLADALLIANIFNSDLFKRTMHRYMKLCPKPYMTILRANVDGDWEALVRTRPVGQWRETLALLATYTSQDEWFKQCEVLAGRLAGAGMHHAALLCHICAGNVDGAVAFWAKSTGSTANVDRLQMVIEKSVIMGLATGSSKGSAALSDLVTSYAGLLAAQGRLTTAYEYLDYAPGEASTTVAVLRDRIYRSGAAHVTQGGIPPFPFVLEDVKSTPIPRAAPAPAPTIKPAPGHQGGWGTDSNPGYPVNPGVPSTGYPAPVNPPAWGGNVYPVQPAPTPSAWGGNVYPVQPGITNAGGQHAGSYPGSLAGGTGSAPSYNTPVTSYPGVGQGGGQGAYSQQPPASQPYPPFLGQQQPYQPEPSHLSKAGPDPPTFKPVTSKHPIQQPAYQPAPQTAPPAPVVADSYTHHRTSGSASQQPAVPPYQVPAPAPPARTGNMYGQATNPSGGFVSTPSGGYDNNVHQPPTPKAPAPPPPPVCPANISVATADTANVPADHRPIITSLTQLYNSCMPLATNPAKKREMDDNTKKVGQLFWRLNQGEVTEAVIPKLLQLCQAIDAADWHTANHIQVQMTTTDWEECGFWLSAVKRLIKMRQTVAP